MTKFQKTWCELLQRFESFLKESVGNNRFCGYQQWKHLTTVQGRIREDEEKISGRLPLHIQDWRLKSGEDICLALLLSSPESVLFYKGLFLKNVGNFFPKWIFSGKNIVLNFKSFSFWNTGVCPFSDSLSMGKSWKTSRKQGKGHFPTLCYCFPTLASWKAVRNKVLNMLLSLWK